MTNKVCLSMMGRLAPWGSHEPYHGGFPSASCSTRPVRVVAAGGATSIAGGVHDTFRCRNDRSSFASRLRDPALVWRVVRRLPRLFLFVGGLRAPLVTFSSGGRERFA